MTAQIGPVSVLASLLSGALLLLASDTSAQSTANPPAVPPTSEDDTGRRVQVLFDDRPAVEIGDTIRVEFGLRLDTDIRTDDASEVKRGAFAWNGRRLELAGKVTERVDFEISRDLGAGETWRDAFVDVRATRRLSVRGGRFKVPFSDERLRSLGKIDFVNRSLAADALAPGRDDGVMAHGEIGEAFEYAAGVFRASVREGAERDPLVRDRGGDPLAAARVTLRPFASAGSAGKAGGAADGDARLRSLRLGVSVLRGSSDARLTSLGAETFDARADLFEPVYVNGPRTGIGTELQWSPGRLRVNAEWIDIREARHGQALDGRDLPALHGRGWYTSAVWRVARWRHKQDDSDDHWLARSLLRELEIGARFESLAFGTGPGVGAGMDDATGGGGGADAGVLHPRAEIIPWQRLRALTLGTTWRLNKYSRIQLNAIDEQSDALALSASGQARAAAHRWSGVIRLQVQM